MSRSIIYGYFPTGVKWLLIVNTAIFVIEYLGGRTVQSLLSPMALVPDLVVYSFPFYVWQLFTYMFLHVALGTCCSTCWRCGCSACRWSRPGERGSF